MPYFPPASSSSVTPPFRNRLINGSWRFDQVNEGTAYSFASTAAQAMDGWTGSATGAGTFTMQRVADPDNASLFACKFACTVADAAIAATDHYYAYTALEGYDVADLLIGTASASQITISFPMKFDVTGTYGISLTNSAVTRAYIGTVTQNVASTRENKTVTLTLDTTGTWLYTNGVGLYLNFTLAGGANFQGAAGAWSGSGTNATTTSAQCNFMSANTNVGYIGRIQLEKASSASAFDEVSYQADLARVQRWAWKTFAQGTAAVQNLGANTGEIIAPSTAAALAIARFGSARWPVTMRAAPTLTFYNPGAANAQIQNQTTGVDCTSTAGANLTDGGGLITCTTDAGGAVGNRLGVHVYANARLS